MDMYLATIITLLDNICRAMEGVAAEEAVRLLYDRFCMTGVILDPLCVFTFREEGSLEVMVTSGM